MKQLVILQNIIMVIENSFLNTFQMYMILMVVKLHLPIEDIIYLANEIDVRSMIVYQFQVEPLR